MGKTTALGVRDSADIYGKKPSDSEYIVVSHRGYAYAKQSGEYTFTVPVSDNIVAAWIGPNAVSGYTRSNANLFQEWGGTSAVYKMTVEKGKYYPIRIMWANAGGPGSFQFEIKAPDGTVVADSKSGASKFLVQYSCDGTSAPKFTTPFGSET